MARTLVIFAVLVAGAWSSTRVQAAPAARASKESIARRLIAARELCKETRWGEAVAVLEEAVEAAPHAARVLSELGWAAFRAGDHAKARRVLDRAARRARDPAVKASILYNLGRVDEAAGRVREARRRYRESLALRADDVVARRLASLEYQVDQPLPVAARDDEGRCGEPRALGELCACLAASVGGDEDGTDRTCELGDEVAEPGLRVLELRVGGMEYLFLLQARGDAWSAVSRLAELWSPGAFGRHGQFEGVSTHRESVGVANLLWFRVRAASHDEDLGVNEVSLEETETETVCILGAAGEAPRCPLSVPVRSTHERRQLHDPSDLTEEELANVREHGTKGLPIHRSQTLRIDVGEDGVAQVVLVEGTEPGDVTLGLHRLW